MNKVKALEPRITMERCSDFGHFPVEKTGNRREWLIVPRIVVRGVDCITSAVLVASIRVPGR
jgi:hypothetical protein